MTKVQYIEADVMLLAWNESHNRGGTITFQLADVAQLEPFKRMTLKKGKIAGQMFTAVFVETDGNGNPVTPEPEAPAQKRRGGGRFPTGYCGLAVKWSGEQSFIQWLMDVWPESYDACVAIIGDPVHGDAHLDQIGAWCIKKLCGIKSRKELDTNDAARAFFDEYIRQPYAARRKELGLDEG